MLVRVTLPFQHRHPAIFIGWPPRDRSMEEPLDYARSGVDINREGSAVAALIGGLSAVRAPGQVGASVDLPGGFGGLIEFGEHLLALATDGVGSKLQIASSLERWEGVGIDCMAMNVNDLLCVGAEPIAFVDYIAVPQPDPAVHRALGASLAEAARRARVTIAGGETATLPGIVRELDLSGTALGWLPRGKAITGASLEPGDVLIGLPSSGLHSNGYSLVRLLLERSGADLDAPPPFEVRTMRRIESHGPTVTLGDVLLNPTRIYVDPVVDLIDACRSGSGPAPDGTLRAIAHITGGGLSNLLRLHDHLGWRIDDPMPVHAEFDWLQDLGSVTDWEMHRTFNMGMGMCLAVEAVHATSILDWLQDRGAGAQRVGSVTEGERVVQHVLEAVRYESY